MSTTIWIYVIIALCFALVIYNYLHKKHIHFTVAELATFINKVFEQANASSVEKKHFLASLKQHYHCSSKEAMYLLGKARENNLITVEEKNVKIVK